MLLRRLSDWPAWGYSSPLEELERMRRQMEWLSGGLTRGLWRESGAGVFQLVQPGLDVGEIGSLGDRIPAQAVAGCDSGVVDVRWVIH